MIVFDKTGKQIAQIDVPERWTANVSFGGKDHETLVIAASTGLYSIQTKFRGANAAKKDRRRDVCSTHRPSTHPAVPACNRA